MNTEQRRGRLRIAIAAVALALLIAPLALAQQNICLPCIKEILNGFAKSVMEQGHAAAQATPAQIVAGQISEADGEKFLRDLSEIDKEYTAKMEKLLTWRASVVKPVYKLGKAGEGG